MQLCHRPVKCNIELPSDLFDKLPSKSHFALSMATLQSHIGEPGDNITYM